MRTLRDDVLNELLKSFFIQRLTQVFFFNPWPINDMLSYNDDRPFLDIADLIRGQTLCITLLYSVLLKTLIKIGFLDILFLY